MKKITLAIAGLALIGNAVFAQTNTVLSRNAVGYVKATIPKGKLALLRNDFEDITGRGLAITNVIGDQVPDGSTVLIWDYSFNPAPKYIAINKAAPGRGGWGAAGTNRLLRGRSFFLQIPSGAVSNEYQVYLMGEVPDKTTAPTTSVTVINTLGMYGLPYPVSEYWTNTTLAKQAVDGDTLLLWNGTNYVAYNKAAPGRGGWGAGTNVVLTPGQGFWFRTSAASSNWMVGKPYTWP
jgi:hypothetical protein